MRLNKQKFVFLLIAGILLILQAWPNRICAADKKVPEDQIEIIIKETNFVKQSHILLGDISDIHADAFLKETLEKTDLGPSPKPDKIKFIDKKKIVSVLRGQRYLPKDIIITSPERIYVKRMSQTILKQDVKNYVEQSLSRIYEKKEYQVISFSVRGLESYPQGKIRFVADAGDMVDKNGKLSFFLDIIIDGKKEDRVSVKGSVAVYETVLQMKRSFAKGERLSREDVCQEKRNIFELGDDVIKTVEEIDGKNLKSGVRKGDYLTAAILVEPPLIQKGDIITLIARNENLIILTTGVSREDGYKNDLINVENLDSGKLVRGIVKEKSKVEVVY